MSNNRSNITGTNDNDLEEKTRNRRSILDKSIEYVQVTYSDFKNWTKRTKTQRKELESMKLIMNFLMIQVLLLIVVSCYIIFNNKYQTLGDDLCKVKTFKIIKDANSTN